MVEQQWEYCWLVIRGAEKHKRGKRGGEEGWSYNCEITYLGLSGLRDKHHVKLTQLDGHILNFNPFLRAITLLGAAGWELVSVQHGLDAIGRAYYYAQEYALHSAYAYAYFKRPVEPGRDVDEPSIDILQDRLVPKQSHSTASS